MFFNFFHIVMLVLLMLNITVFENHDNGYEYYFWETSKWCALYFYFTFFQYMSVVPMYSYLIRMII